MFGVTVHFTSKMAPGEVGGWLLFWCHSLVLSAPGNWGLTLNLIIFSLWKNDQFQQNFRSKLKVLNCSNFTLWKFTLALSWKSHAHFSWGHFTSKMACHTKHFRRQCIYRQLASWILDNYLFEYLLDMYLSESPNYLEHMDGPYVTFMALFPLESAIYMDATQLKKTV